MTTNANTIPAYRTSTDYKRLAELARCSSVVCFVDYRIAKGEPIRDIARTQYSHHRDQEVFVIAARGIGYIHAFGEDEFLKFCSHSNVEFIEPPQDTAGTATDQSCAWGGAVMRAYGHLWHVNADPAAPVPTYPAERAAAEARMALRSLLSKEQRGEAINTVGRQIGRYPDGDRVTPPRCKKRIFHE
jgi:hypothetical protein